jgi:hypothetical protein
MDVLYQLSYAGELRNHSIYKGNFQFKLSTGERYREYKKVFSWSIIIGMANPKKLRPNCPVCGKEPARSFYKYCSNICQQKYQQEQYLQAWREGNKSGLQTTGIVTKAVKRYLREKFGDKCCLCGWSKINEKTGKVPLVADHIDGNWRNNTESNLRLICPNCDALLPTFSNLNRGNGRVGRAVSKRTTEAKVFLKNKPK